ncbi:MAG TPA: hypothetical protein HPP90_05325 [Deltaproteobacteria bacterium]|nr:hypothetical protein [Deltaproteobacteria bacterium]
MKRTVLVISGAFVSGVVLGANRPLLKFLSPSARAGGKGIAKMYHCLLTFIVRRKEHIEDLVAEAKM